MREATSSSIGAYHAIEMPFIFDNLEKQEIKITQRVDVFRKPVGYNMREGRAVVYQTMSIEK